MRHHDALTKILQAAASGQKRLDLTSMGLTSLPPELAALQELETLDLSGNALADLPGFLAEMTSLKRLFLTKNQFSAWPRVLAQLPGLEMVSLKSNQLARMPDLGYLPVTLKWLILTDNLLEYLPADFGHALPRLRKLALAGNRLEELPASFAELQELELLRLGMNRLGRRPPELEPLKRLTWLGLGGNPYGAHHPGYRRAQQKLAACRLDPGDFVLRQRLGSGASGVVYRADWTKHPGAVWAIKQFKAVSSDGRPEDELAIAAIAALEQVGVSRTGIIPFRGWWPEGGMAMVMDYLEAANPLGLVPSFESITRDCYPIGFQVRNTQLHSLLATLAAAQAHLISHQVIHGDFYAHNILMDPGAAVHLGDWGASYFFDEDDAWMEGLEVRAFGCLMEELLERCPDPAPELQALRDCCLSSDPALRPTFAAIKAVLAAKPCELVHA